MSEINTAMTGTLFAWQAPSHFATERGPKWIAAMSLFLVSVIALCVWQGAYVVALPFALVGVMYALTYHHDVEVHEYAITTEGICENGKLAHYDEIKHFSIHYDPEIHHKVLDIVFEKRWKPNLHIQLHDADPQTVRTYLSVYLDEVEYRVSSVEYITRVCKL